MMITMQNVETLANGTPEVTMISGVRYGDRCGRASIAAIGLGTY